MPVATTLRGHDAAPDCASLEAALAPLRAGDGDALRAAGVVLRASNGERTLDGRLAASEGIAEVSPVVCVGGSAAALLRSDCARATLVGLAWRAGRWQVAGHAEAEAGSAPGHCSELSARADAAPLTGPERRELLVETRAVSDDGDEDSGRVLRVAHLDGDGTVTWYRGRIALDAFDPATGAATQGRWDFVEELPAPRDLYIEERPLHGGLAGEPAATEILRATWRIAGDAIVRVEVLHERVQPRTTPR